LTGRAELTIRPIPLSNAMFEVAIALRRAVYVDDWLSVDIVLIRSNTSILTWFAIASSLRKRVGAFQELVSKRTFGYAAEHANQERDDWRFSEISGLRRTQGDRDRVNKQSKGQYLGQDPNVDQAHSRVQTVFLWHGQLVKGQDWISHCV